MLLSQDLVIIGAGTSGTMCALGAIKNKLKVALILNCNEKKIRSSLLTEIIPGKTLGYCANIFNTIKNANNFGIDVNYSINNLNKVNNYIDSVITEFEKENELKEFEKLGGNIITGNARFININCILVGKLQIYSKYFVIATGTREVPPNIVNITSNDFINYSDIFKTNLFIGKIIILGGRSESLEIAQTLARFGNKVSLIFHQNNLFPLEDQELINKLKTILNSEGVKFYFINKILEFYVQKNRKILLCQDNLGYKVAIEGEYIINLQEKHPNIEELELNNVSVKFNKQGIIVNNKLQTTQNNIFALGSVIDSPIKSIHATEYQTNIILSNIIFKIPKKLNYKLIPRIIYTDPQLASAGITKIKNLTQTKKTTSIKTLEFDFKNIDAAIYQQKTLGGVKIIVANNKILGGSILGFSAAEMISEFTLAMQTGIDLSEIAQNIHIYPSMSQINKRVAHKIFDYIMPKSMKLTRILLKIQDILNKTN